jgi:hypothetical protein
MNNYNDVFDEFIWEKFGKAITEKVALLKEQIA